MGNLSKREITLLLILVVAMVVAILYNFALRPYLKDSAEIKVEYVSIQDQIDDAKIKQAAIAMIDNKMEVINNELGVLKDNVLPVIDRPVIIATLIRTVTPLVINPVYQFAAEPTEFGMNYVTTVVIDFDCTEEVFLTILGNLRNDFPVSRIASASLEETDDLNGTFSARINLEFLVISDEPAK